MAGKHNRGGGNEPIDPSLIELAKLHERLNEAKQHRKNKPPYDYLAEHAKLKERLDQAKQHRKNKPPYDYLTEHAKLKQRLGEAKLRRKKSPDNQTTPLDRVNKGEVPEAPETPGRG